MTTSTYASVFVIDSCKANEINLRAHQPSYTLCDGYEAAELASAVVGAYEGYPTLAGHSVNEFINKIRVKPRNPRLRKQVHTAQRIGLLPHFGVGVVRTLSKSCLS